jgi:hypothetical protein
MTTRVRLHRGIYPMTTSMAAHWSMEEASGSRLDDHGGNTLADNNTVTRTAGTVGFAAQFVAASSEYLSIADNAALSMGDIDLTISAWVYLDTKAANMGILGKWSGANPEYLLWYETAADRISILVRNTANSAQTTQRANTFGAVPTATWLHVVAWHDSVNNLVGISVNAGTPDTIAHTGGVRDSTQAFEIGRFNSANYFNGRIDQPAIWKRVLTAADRTWLYNAGAGRSWADVQAYRYR